jgi:hypothetical protein
VLTLRDRLPVLQCKSEPRVVGHRRSRVCIAHTTEELRRNQFGVWATQQGCIHRRNVGLFDLGWQACNPRDKETVSSIVIGEYGHNRSLVRPYHTRTYSALFLIQSLRVFCQRHHPVNSYVKGNGFADVLCHNYDRGADKRVLPHHKLQITDRDNCRAAPGMARAASR